jgi:hypothetical protein
VLRAFARGKRVENKKAAIKGMTALMSYQLFYN